MAIIELYSKRKNRAAKGQSDVFIYDNVPSSVRHQLVQILQAAYDDFNRNHSSEKYFWMTGDDFEVFVSVLRREYGVPALARSYEGPAVELKHFILDCSTDEFLDCIEIVCRLIENSPRLNSSAKNDYLHELNYRLREAGLGYEYTGSQIVRVDSRLLHAEVLKPALHLLSSSSIYQGAEDELFIAFEYHKKGEQKEAIANALKAFESCMKAILTKRAWTHQPTDAAAKLLTACFSNGLIPAYLQSHFTGLRTMLEAGVPTVRNKVAGHGQGSTPVVVPDHLVSYVLYTAAADIKLLIECEMALP